MKILYRGPFCNRSGYGQAAHDYMMALHTIGLDFDIQAVVDADTDDLHDRYKPLLDHLAPDKLQNNYSHVIVHAIPILSEGLLDGIPPEMKKILITTWETDKLHVNVVPQLNKHWDLIVVPSRFNADLFIASGVDPKKLCIIPHAYDPTAWGDMRAFKEKYESLKDDYLERPYTFYQIGVWTARKNPLGAITAYLAEFGPDENVCFKHVAPKYYKEELLTLIKAGSIQRPPRLEILGVRGEHGGKGLLTDAELRQLHREADCYVQLSRGEGYGLGMFEATLAGNPVIATNYSGQLEFLHDYPGFRPVPYSMTPCLVPPEVLGKPIHVEALEIRTVLGPNTGICFNQSWAEPDIDACRKFMRQAFESRDRTDYRAGFYSHILRDKYEYASVGRQLKNVLESA